jgi:hypothetical protein
MTEQRVLDFLAAVVCGESDLPLATVNPVRFQVRTGMMVPAKKQMRKTDYELLIWRYRVNDLKAFSAFLGEWEPHFSDEFNNRSREAGYIHSGDPANIVIRQSYVGTLPSRSPGGAAINRFNTSWGGQKDRLAIIDKCRVAIPDQLTSDEERWLAAEVGKLLGHVSGDVEVELLDPSIGF